MRKYKFQELAERDPHSAMLYLQNDLASIVDHKNQQEREEVGTFKPEIDSSISLQQSLNYYIHLRELCFWQLMHNRCNAMTVY